MDDYVPRTHGNMNVLAMDILPGMELADGFKVTHIEEHQGALFARGLAFGFIPALRYLGQYPYGVMTIKVMVN